MSQWTCAQLESRINGYLEGKMARLEFEVADAHARACPRCVEWFQARLTRAWLLDLEELETPPGLETRILASTLAAPPRETLWDTLEQGWRLLVQPRFAFGLAAAVFSLALVFNVMDVEVRQLRAADLNPVNIYRTVDRNAHLAYARGVRFFNELRVVYEIRNQLAAFQSEAEEPATEKPSPENNQGRSSNPQKDNNARKKGNRLVSLAYHQITQLQLRMLP